MKYLPTVLISVGLLCVIAALGILAFTFYPVAMLEFQYNLHRPDATVQVTTKHTLHAIQPLDSEFGIVIPKIGANAKVIPQVDPYNSAIYQVALTKGVAQAKGTSYPYEKGDMFLFSHSAANFYDANHYNALFYLLSKLTKGDKVYIFYKGQKYTYAVTTTKLVNSSDISYLTQKSNEHTLTLMTCWPPGTSLKRLLVQANQVQ